MSTSTDVTKKPRAPRRQKIPPTATASALAVRSEPILRSLPAKKDPRPARGTRAYNAAGSNWRMDGWMTSGSSANTEIQGGLVALRNRSRDAVRNMSWAKAIVGKYVTHLVGSGIRPDLNTGDTKLDTLALALFDRWAKVCTTDGLGFYGSQTLMAQSLVVDGEILGRRRVRYPQDMQDKRGYLPPCQIQLYEADQLDVNYTQAKGGNRIIQSVEFDPLDRRVAYWLLSQHPGEMLNPLGGTSLLMDRVRVPADSCFHLLEVTRPSQVRGVPMLHAALQAIYDLDSSLDAERVRARAAACLVASIEGGNPEEGEPDGVDGMAPAVDSEGETVTDGFGNPIEGMSPGLIMYAPNGKKVVFNDVGAQANVDFIRQSLYEIAASVSLDYSSLVGDFSQGNFSFNRLGRTEMRTRFDQLRTRFFAPLCLTPWWNFFVDSAIGAGLLPDEPGLYDTLSWSSPREKSADQYNDAKAIQMEMRLGLTSRRQAIRDRGDDPDLIDQDIAKDKENRRVLGIVSDGDPSETSLSGGVQPPEQLTLTNEVAA